MKGSGEHYPGVHRRAPDPAGRRTRRPGVPVLLATAGITLVLAGAVLFARHPAGTGNPPAQPLTRATTSPRATDPPTGALAGAPDRSLARAAWGPASYEAESASNTLVSSTRQRPVPGTSGGVVVGNLGHGPAVRFNGVAVPAAGPYTLTIHYLTPDARAATIRVNDGAPVPVDFAPSPGAGPGTRTLVLPLASGANVITVGNPQGRAPDLDRIVVAAPG